MVKSLKPEGAGICTRGENGKTAKCAKMESWQARESENLPIYQYQWVDLLFYRSINHAINLAMYQFINLSIRLSTQRRINLPIYNSNDIPNNQSISLSTYQSANLSIYLSINLSIYQSTDLSSYQSTNVCISQSDYRSRNLATYRINALSFYRYINLLDNEGSLRRSDRDESNYPSINLLIYQDIKIPT